ncbi:MAG: hypothetical protein CAPSK01_000306 [Candidatus Accumulibacter vicinus]|uniref:Uncharacterized protein n=1 Tax=Candidatus Accumulibacter vicinus TaxID=2954382 RepID=A0A084Y5B6_9PROT|nr:MAG: hypothetical protein CAPSK01_000306 [Candidatus Accumulibacter vicinus]
MTRPITTSTAMTNRPIINIDASSSPKPKCEASAAKPRPAASPASGPIHERLGWAACAAADCAAPVACVGAAVALSGMVD